MKRTETIWALITFTLLWVARAVFGAPLHPRLSLPPRVHFIDYAVLSTSGAPSPFPSNFVMLQSTDELPHSQRTVATWLIAQLMRPLEILQHRAEDSARTSEGNDAQLGFAAASDGVTLRMQLSGDPPEPARGGGPQNPQINTIINWAAIESAARSISFSIFQGETWGQLFFYDHATRVTVFLSWGLGRWKPNTGPVSPGNNQPPPPPPADGDPGGGSGNGSGSGTGGGTNNPSPSNAPTGGGSGGGSGGRASRKRPRPMRVTPFGGEDPPWVTTTDPDEIPLGNLPHIDDPAGFCQRQKCAQMVVAGGSA